MKRFEGMAKLVAPFLLLTACTGTLESTAEPVEVTGIEEQAYWSERALAAGLGPDAEGEWPDAAETTAGEAPAHEDPDPASDEEAPAEDAAPTEAPEEEPAPEEPAPEDATPAADPAPPTSGGGSGPGAGVASLGPLPGAMGGLRWPAAPTTTRTVVATSAADVSAAASVAGTRVDVRGAIGGDVSVTANDVHIVADATTDLGVLSFARGVHRVQVSGGHWAGFRFAIPADFGGGSPSYDAGWMVTDVLVEDAIVDSPDIAFAVRGQRIALVNNDVTAIDYSVWCGDTGPLQSEDVILHRNVFDSSGPEATVRLVQVLRSATVDNTLANTFKHNYRIHGVSDLNYASDNVLIGTGVMLGRMPGDTLGRVWFDDNVFHHDAPDLFNPQETISDLRARNNVVHTDVHAAFYARSVPAGWDLADNVVHPYAPPPS